ncbi:membrane protein insertase YidC [Candidatus Poribacteria bacterium]|nr:membrane protein insertase YidC [Candidatus Poribacteria bacterium]MYG08467.1 membrane protein insertase YidC [Candidatus Poribacteria bacterium]MYK24000.1 membrane protein insertase YidC [Candidatus Poribacteria bacterium]
MGARYILALVLMIAVMIAWSLFLAPKPNEIPPTEETPVASDTGETPIDPTTQATPDAPDAPISSDLWTAVEESPDDAMVNVRTDNYHIIFNEKLAIAKQWRLSHFPDRSDRANAPLNLIPENALDCLALRFANSQLQLDALRATWRADQSEIDITNGQAKETLTFTTTIGEKLRVAKQFTFSPGTYFVDMAVTFQNISEEPLLMGGTEPVNGYELQWGRGINADLLPHEKRSGKRGRRVQEGAKAYIGEGKPERQLKSEQALVTVRWAGMDSQYFSALMIPDPQLAATYKLTETPQANTLTDINVTAATDTASLVMPSFYLTAGQKEMQSFRLYIGPKDDTILKSIEAPNTPESEENPVRLSKIIDFGFFSLIAWGMLWIFKGVHAVCGNYGISIILLTAFVKIISYPFTRKAHNSMKKMQKLQPQLLELKEKYRDDPQKLNRATMRLYKENGVNPLGGCIPWLPQIPIFWALFALLGSAVELRGAPFFLWIDDLSAPDTLIELPFTIPLIFTQIDAIRLLPIINGLTTWLQQKFVGNMTPTTDNMQAKLMQFMPLIFIFIFYNWASGFVLYWLCNNVFTIAQQYIQNRSATDEEQVAVVDTRKRNNAKQK